MSGTHATMCGNTQPDERGGCFVPWCTCWCHRSTEVQATQEQIELGGPSVLDALQALHQPPAEPARLERGAEVVAVIRGTVHDIVRPRRTGPSAGWGQVEVVTEDGRRAWIDTSTERESVRPAPTLTLEEVLAAHVITEQHSGDGHTSPREAWLQCSCGGIVWEWQQFYDETDEDPEQARREHLAAELRAAGVVL